MKTGTATTTHTMRATLEDGGTLEITCSGTREKAMAAMDAALTVIQAKIVYREPIGLIGAIKRWMRS